MEDLETVRGWDDERLFGVMYQIEPGSPRYKVLHTEVMRRQLEVARKSSRAAHLSSMASRVSAVAAFLAFLAAVAGLVLRACGPAAP